jgi:hypothetical protein
MSGFNPQGIPERVLRRRKLVEAHSSSSFETSSPSHSEADSPFGSEFSDHEFDNDNDEDEANDDTDEDEANDDEFDEDIAMLQDFSLVTRAIEATSEIHPLVQLCTKLWLSTDRIKWEDKFLSLMPQEFPIVRYET